MEDRQNSRYTKKLLLYFAGVFTCFAVILVAFQLRSERKYKEEILQSKLSAYADIIAASGDYSGIMPVLPPELRVSVIGRDGKVLFDTGAAADSLDNHSGRPEVRKSLSYSEGISIRKSDTMGMPYFYYAKSYDSFLVRVALPYEINVKRFFRPDILFLVLVFSLFVLAIFLLVFLTDRFGEGISRLLKRSDSMVALEKEKNRIMKRQMTNNIAHELRTPVSSIRGYLETLLSCPDIPEDRRNAFIDRAYVQTLRLSDLIRDIALITKMEEAPDQLQKERVALKTVVDEVFEEFRENIQAKNISVEDHLTDDLVINGNATLIYAVFRNLVENSIKYGGEGIKVHVECTGRGNGVLNFIYYDTGSGVGEDHLSRIFERFYRVSEGRTRKDAGGSGLGLSIVRHAVAFHGGDIVARSRPEGGLEFVFSFATGRDSL